jgi:putative flippase GtrA
LAVVLDQFGQILRFGIVGLLSNIAIYLLYLILTGNGVEHKTAMTVLYAAGFTSTYLFNRNWTFKSSGKISTSFPLYVLTYVIGYFINLFFLFALVDLAGFDHRLVQGCMILVVAAFLFFTQKRLIFKDQ